MSNNERAKLLPGYTDTADAVEENGKKLDDLKEQLSETNALLSSLNKYHGDPESETGYLEQILNAILCIKAKLKRHMSIGLKVTVITLVFAGIALVTEIASKGKYPIFTITWDYLKGLF